MSEKQTTRREFLKTTTLAAAAGSMPYWFTSQSARAFSFNSANERPVLGCIGTGSRWEQIVGQAMQYADVAAVCDVDARHVGRARERVTKGAKKNKDVATYEDYRELLDRRDIDVVTVVTPDHWHTKPAIDAMRSGRDVYCEKPLTLTIQEGKQIRKVLDETGRVFQVGTQQRSEYYDNKAKIHRFLGAVAMVHAGRIGKLRRVTCAIGGAPTSGPIPKADPPEGLNWEMWLGQAPLVDYRYAPDGRWGKSRCHYEFRWWYEYSGGKMTDWGAHHVDIAQWAIGQNGPGQGPTEIIPVSAEHPVPLENGMPTLDDRYNTATAFLVKAIFPGGVELVIRHDTDNGITFEGDEGTFFAYRGGIRDVKGTAVADLARNPIPEDQYTALYKGKNPGGHMRNFFECVKDRQQPISDVHTHHRALTTCHLANIAIRLGRKLTWDPQTEQIVGDSEANSWQAREQRKGYEIDGSV